MKGLIYYFSGTGNTEFIADEFIKRFEDNNINVDKIAVENSESCKIENYDFLIVGFPIYADNAPEFMLDWIKRNIKKTKVLKKVMIYSTQVSSGCGTEVVKQMLLKRGYEVMYSKSISMPNNYYFSIFKETSKEKQVLMIEEAKKDVLNAVDMFLKNVVVTEKHSKARVIAAKAVGKSFNLFAKKMGKKFSISDSCIDCGKCEKNCPVSNIDLSKRTYKNSCIMCTRCLHVCPVNAIRYNDKKYNQYNLHLKNKR